MNIEGCASLLTDAVGDNKDSKELLTYIKEEVNHILQINNRMLSFSNLTQENTYGQIDVNEVLKNCVSALYTQRTKKKLSIETKMGADLPLVRRKMRISSRSFLTFCSVPLTMQRKKERSR